MRGTVNGSDCEKGGLGITPACAGNSCTKLNKLTSKKDHPRVCGEQKIPETAFQEIQGSPPRVRGTAQLVRDYDLIARITPACAGNRPRESCTAQGREDHPRVCGEQVWPCGPCGPLMGSPPRVRGTAPVAVNPNPLVGITPACAGNRLKKARHFYILFCQIKRIHLV